MRAESQVASPSTSAGTLLHLLQERASRTPKQDAATHKKFGKWTHVDWVTILDDVRHLSAALVARGVQPGDRVAIFADSSLPWCVVDMAICAARAITVPIYASNTPDEVKYVLQHSGSVMLFVDHDRSTGKQPGRFTRARSVLRDCPAVRQVITMEEEGTGAEVSLAKLLAEGTPLDQKDPRKFEERIGALRVDDACCFIYTSGTTGAPKGVMLTHGNLAYEAKALTTLQILRQDDAVMLFLPLAHSFAQDVKAAWVGLGYRMIFAQSTDTLLADIGETSPTILPAVPRIFEKIYNAVVSGGTSKPGVAGKLFRWAMRLFEESVEARLQGRSYDSLSLHAGQEAGVQQGEGHAGPEARRQDAPVRLGRRAALAEDRLLLRHARLRGPRGLRADRDHRRGHGQPAGARARSAASGRRCPGARSRSPPTGRS